MKKTVLVIGIVVLVTLISLHIRSVINKESQAPQSLTEKTVDVNSQTSLLKAGAKNVLDRFTAKYPTSEYAAEPILAYSDDTVIAMWEPQGNGGLCLNTYDTSSLESLGKTEGDAGACVWYKSLETERYIINVRNGGIIYYKKGSDRIVMVPESSLSQNEEGIINHETYYQYEDGPDQRPDFIFDESSKTLKVSVFQRNEAKDGISVNTKIRTTRFVLP